MIGQRLRRDQHCRGDDHRPVRVGLSPLARIHGWRWCLDRGVRRRHRRWIGGWLAPTGIGHASGCQRSHRPLIAARIIGRGVRPRDGRKVWRGRPNTRRRSCRWSCGDRAVGRRSVTSSWGGLRWRRWRGTERANLAGPRRLRSRQGCFPTGLGKHGRSRRQLTLAAISRRRRRPWDCCRGGARPRCSGQRGRLRDRRRRNGPFLGPGAGRTSGRSGRGRWRAQGLLLTGRQGRCSGNRWRRSQPRLARTTPRFFLVLVTQGKPSCLSSELSVSIRIRTI